MRQINSFHTLGFNFTSNNFLHYHKSIILELRFLIVRVKYSRKREFPLFIKLILCLNIHIRFQLFKQLLFFLLFISQVWARETIQLHRNAQPSRRRFWVHRRIFFTISTVLRRNWRWLWRSHSTHWSKCHTVMRTWTRIRNSKSTMTTKSRQSVAVVRRF